ncbi:MAG: response regulator transcription factor [Cyanobacteria bacterium SZAS TMP-1]|nr:response regulator transcription factor [Cyanobacteria bacterium SZAS TMP-1]
MNPPNKVFIVDNDRLSLVTLSLWLEQVKDFEIVGTSMATASLEQNLIDGQPDMVVLSLASAGPEAVSNLRRIHQTLGNVPVVILYDGDKKNLEGPLTHETEAQLNPDISLKDFVEVLRKLGLRQKVVTNPAGNAMNSMNSLMPKAG